MNEKTINRIDSFFKILFNVYLALLILFAAVVLYFNFDTFKGNIEYGIGKVQSFLLSVEGKTQTMSDNDFNEIVSLCGASEEDRVLYSIKTGNTTMLSERELQLYAVVKSFVDKQSGKSQFEIVKAVNDYICKNTVYAHHLIDYNQAYDDSQTAYGSLVLGQTVCAGYSRAANLLLNACQVEAIYVKGWVPGEDGGSHAWSMVKLDSDGEWFHLDVTWNDMDDEGSWNYDYFLKSDDWFAQSRTWERWMYHECPSSIIIDNNNN